MPRTGHQRGSCPLPSKLARRMCFDLAGYSCLSRSGSGRTVSSSFGLRFVPMNLVRVMFGSVLRDVALACDVAAEGGVRHGCVVLIDEAFPDVTCGNAGVGVEHRVDVSMEPEHGVGPSDSFLGCRR